MASVLVASCALGIGALLANISRLPLLDDVGYVDSYVMFDVLHLQKTGVIYRDLSQPPYLPAVYSPMVYVLFSLPGRFATWENFLIGPRLVTLAAFIGCIALVISITRVLMPARSAWIWAVLLACSLSGMRNWVLQIRGDFPGTFFGLLALRLLLSPSPWAAPLAGACAGFTLQFKITFVAASLAGAVWFATERRWKDLATFAALAAVTSLGPYLVFALREPHMLAHMFAVSPGLVDVAGDLGLFRDVVGELVVLFALLGVAHLGTPMSPRWTLVVTFAAASFTLATLTNIQTGGNVNYYFESLLAAVPIAVVGIRALLTLVPNNIVLALFVVVYVSGHFLVAGVQDLRRDVRRAKATGARNDEFRRVAGVLQGHRIFTTVPRLALFDPAPPITEPFLLSYLHQLGRMDPELVAKDVRDGEYEAVVTGAGVRVWRGLPHIDPQLHQAIAASYQPHCVMSDWLFHLPKHGGAATTVLARDLSAIGCVPPSPAPAW